MRATARCTPTWKTWRPAAASPTSRKPSWRSLDRAVEPRQDNPAWRKLRTPRTYASASAAPFPADSPQQVTFDLLPTSVLFRAGDRIRITIAAADPDAFQLPPADGNATYRIGHSAAHPSFAELPVVG